MKIKIVFGFYIFWAAVGFAADPKPAESAKPDLLARKYIKLAGELEKAVNSFDTSHEALSSLSYQEKKAIEGAKFWEVEGQVHYVCRCEKVGANRGPAMASLISGVEWSMAKSENPVAALLFLGSSVAVTEFVLIDALLLRNENLVVSVDLVDVVYNTSGEVASKIQTVVGILFDALARKYPGRIYYSLRNEDFSLLPSSNKSLNFLWNEYPILIKNKAVLLGPEFMEHARSNYEDCFANQPSSLFNTGFIHHVQRADSLTLVLAAFDIEDKDTLSGLKSYRAVEGMLEHINYFKPTSRKLKTLFRNRPWQLFNVLVAEGQYEANIWED